MRMPKIVVSLNEPWLNDEATELRITLLNLNMIDKILLFDSQTQISLNLQEKYQEIGPWLSSYW